MKRLTSSVGSVLRPINRTYFEPKIINASDQLNLLHKNGNISDETLTDIDDDIELGLEDHINHTLHSSHQSLIDNHPIIIDPDTTNRCHEWIKATAWRIKQSVQFFLLYLILIILNAFVLVWEVSDGGDRRICIILEGIITLMFLGEVAVQIITEEWNNYWQSWLNRIDLIICILCVMLYVIFASVEAAPHSHYNVGNYMDAVIVGIRYTMQAVRLIRFATRGNENRRMLDQDQVKFDDHMTLSVLHQHGVSLPKNNTKHKHSNNKLNNKYLLTLEKLKKKLFNPNFNALIKGNELQLKHLKSSIEMINMDPDDNNEYDNDNETKINEMDNVSSDNDNDNYDNISSPIVPNINNRINEMDLFNIDNMDNLNINKNNNNNEQFQSDQSDIYTTDDTITDTKNKLNKYGFVYDSEQMTIYQNISNDRIVDTTDDTNLFI